MKDKFVKFSFKTCLKIWDQEEIYLIDRDIEQITEKASEPCFLKKDDDDIKIQKRRRPV